MDRRQYEISGMTRRLGDDPAERSHASAFFAVGDILEMTVGNERRRLRITHIEPDPIRGSTFFTLTLDDA